MPSLLISRDWNTKNVEEKRIHVFQPAMMLTMSIVKHFISSHFISLMQTNLTSLETENIGMCN